VVAAARLLGQAGDMERTIAACELALRVAARSAVTDDRRRTELAETTYAADFLRSVGRLDSQQSALLVAATAAAIGPGMTINDKRQVLQAAELLASAGGADEAVQLLGEAAQHASGDDADRRITDALYRLRACPRTAQSQDPL
jgi:hypothetical protein